MKLSLKHQIIKSDLPPKELIRWIKKQWPKSERKDFGLNDNSELIEYIELLKGAIRPQDLEGGHHAPND